jgi:CHAT domain-containing protein
LAERQRQVERRLSRLQSQLIESYSGKSIDPNQIRTLGLALDGADAEYRNLRREIRDSNSRYAELRYPAPVSLRETKGMLGEKTLLLEYVLGKDSSFLFAVTRDEHLVARLPGTLVLTQRINKLREAISTQPSRANLSNYWLQAQALYRELVAPAGRLLTGRDEIIVAADGILHYLPFNALLTPTRDLPGEIDPVRLPYLARNYAVSYVPSASVLATMRRYNETPANADKMFVAYGDPSYETRHASASRDRMRGSLNFASLRSLPRLQNSRREVERIAALYPRSAAEVFLGERATEENVKNVALDRYRIVHFAAHGLLNEENPQFSGLLLSRPTGKKSEEREDGLLQVYEIFNLKLNADLVVLSACQTGLGRAVKGEGLVGMTQAFFYAGASSVLMSLWNVEDRSTAELMIRFHRHIRRGDLDKAQALRRAQLELIGTTVFAHPYYWAAFSLTGDSRSRVY